MSRHLLELQRSAGNQAVAGLLEGRAAQVRQDPSTPASPSALQRWPTWEQVAGALASLGKPSRVGKKWPTAHPRVWVREVEPHTAGGDMGEGDLELKRTSGIKASDELHGKWGTTVSSIVIDYAVRQGKDGRYLVSVVQPHLSIVIQLLPDAEFPPLSDFAPHYRRLQDEFGGDKKLFARAWALGLASPFAVPEGTLYHEGFHAANARRDAKRRERQTYAAAGASADSAEEARSQFLEAMDKVWEGFPDETGWTVDHVAIYEKQVLRVLKIYEASVAARP